VDNVYDSVSVPSSAPTVVNGVTVPQRAPYSFKGLIIWSTVDCDIEIRKNTDLIGGGCLTGAVPVLFLDYHSSPFGLDPSDVISVTVTQVSGGAVLVKSTLLVEQL